MPRLSCCVSSCRGKGTTKDPNLMLIPFPKDVNLAEEWKRVCGLPPEFVLKPLTRVCSLHFRTGKRSLNPDSEDYVPSVFEAASPLNRRSYCPSCKKVTLTCPCKVIAAVQQSVAEDDDDESVEGEGEEYEDEVQNGGNGEVEQDENGDQEEEEEEEYYESEREEVLDDGQVMDSDDDDWTPAAETEANKPRRSTRSRKKRRHASSESSSDGSGQEESQGPPPKVVKKEASPVKKAKSASPVKAAADSKQSTPTPKRRGRRPKSEVSTPGNDNPDPETNSTSAVPATPQTDSPAKPKPATNIRKSIHTPPPQDEKFLAKVKEMEAEFSMKLERIQRNHNMRYANLKEEHVQTVHRMKIEWELEKANLLSQIEYYKETMNHKTDEEPMNPFNGGQPIIVLPAPDHDADEA